MKVTIYHNVDRDSSLGLNQRLVRTTRSPGFRKKAEPKSHALVKVFEYEVDEFTRHQDELNRAFELFNIGKGSVSQAYRARRLRSLSVGDVVAFGPAIQVIGTPAAIYSVDSFGFSEVPAADLRVLQGDEAVQAIRDRYEFRPGETELSVTVPLA